MAAKPDLTRLTTTMYRDGDAPGAQRLAEELLRSHPRSLEARAILGQALAAQLKHDEARTQLLKALKQAPKNPQVLCLLGELAMNTGSYRDAIGYFEKAGKHQPDLVPAIAGKAETYLRMGKPEQARRVLERQRIEPRDPRHVPLCKPLITALLRLGEADAAAALAEDMMPLDPSLPLEHRRAILFARGKALLDANRIDDAFEAFREANDTVAGRWAAQRDDQSALQQRLIDTLDRTALDSMPRADLDASNVVLIVGLPRCGSTLTEQVIDAHPSAHGVGESPAMPALVQSMQDRFGLSAPWPNCHEALSADQLTDLGRRYLDAVTDGVGPDRIVVDKQLGNFMNLGLAQSMLPGVRVIHCLRHPMDLGLSTWTNKFPPDQCIWSDSLEDIADAWHRYVALMRHWETHCSLPLLTVRYEGLVQDLEGHARTILDFCGLTWDDRCLRFWESKRTVLTLSQDQVRQPIYTTASGRHEAWGAHLAPLRNALGDAVSDYERT
ncbi:MAG: sulfotransferase [Planctomycetota bacterium]|nr:sulfotransferase [Planctomycetota bacterium]